VDIFTPRLQAFAVHLGFQMAVAKPDDNRDCVVPNLGYAQNSSSLQLKPSLLGIRTQEELKHKCSG